MTLLEQFLASVPSRDPDACWPWAGSLTKDGYGRLGYQSRTWASHRLVYEILVGPIPEGLQIDHLCRNRACASGGEMHFVRPGRPEKPTRIWFPVWFAAFGDECVEALSRVGVVRVRAS